MTTTRKRTVIEPCERHAARYAAESRRRRAEVMACGGWAGQDPCACRMKPGTDYFVAEFVAARPVHHVYPLPITREAATIGARVMVAGNDEPGTIMEVDRDGWYVVRLWHRGRHVGDVVKPLEEMTPA